MKTHLRTLFALAVSASLCAAQHPAFKVESIPVETGKDRQVGGIDIMPNGKIAVAFHDGEVRLYDPEKKSWSLFASGLHEPLGLVAEDDQTITVVQRPELTQISDTDGDGLADTYTTVCDDFGMSGNYHEFAFGPVKDKDGNYFVALNVASNGAPIREEIRGEWLELGLPREEFYVDKDGWTKVKDAAGRMYSRVPYRGWVVKIDGKSGEMTPWAPGFRSPNGLGFDAKGELYVSDNQGDWLGTSKLYHVEKGKFYGHPASLPWTEGYDGPNPLDIPIPELEKMRTTAAVWFTQTTMANSPTQPILIPDGFGPFGGQMLIGEMNKSRVIRLMLEEVNGVTQGACTPFIDGNGLDMGINRLAFDANGSLILGNTHLSWPGGEGMARITYHGKAPFQDVINISILPEGFRVEFLEKIEDPSVLEEATLNRYTFDYHASYGSKQKDKEDVSLAFAPVGDSGKVFDITLGSAHKKDFCYEFSFPMSFNPLVCYTVREIPSK
ncbi:MAG: PQQ-dependent sugar dehydrogenase [Luteolibacter sp.]